MLGVNLMTGSHFGEALESRAWGLPSRVAIVAQPRRVRCRVQFCGTPSFLAAC
jgi:hypothetical protein